MTLKQFTINANIISSSKHCRLDPKYTCFTQIQDWEVFETKFCQVKLSELLVELPLKKISKGELEEDVLLVNISDQEQNTGELENLEKTDEIGSDKNSLADADIFISKLGMPKGYIFVNTHKGEDIIGSSEFISYELKDIDYIKYLKYILLNQRMLLAYSSLESGKTPSHKRVNPYEFLKIKIPLPSKQLVKKLTSQIEPIDEKIKKLKKQIKKPQESINKVFAREFRFDENLYNMFGKGMTAGTQIAEARTLRVFETDFSELSRSNILRFSTRYHNPPTKKLMKIINDIETTPVKDVIKNYEKGIQPKYNTDGEISVIKIANLKNGHIDFSEAEKISKLDFDKLDDKKKLTINDIIICATGKISLGKIDFYEYENEAITSVDNYILRLNEKYNSLFFTYFFRSVLGYFQIERDFTGATNQIHLYWEQISNFQIPNIPLPEQQRIVDEIKEELDEQEEMKKKIEYERNKIDEIIEKAIK